MVFYSGVKRAMGREDIARMGTEGRHLEEAKKAGADIVGGPELCDGVCAPILSLHFTLK